MKIGEGGIRTHEAPLGAYRFSKPAPSTTQTPLHAQFRGAETKVYHTGDTPFKSSPLSMVRRRRGTPALEARGTGGIRSGPRPDPLYRHDLRAGRNRLVHRRGDLGRHAGSHCHADRHAAGDLERWQAGAADTEVCPARGRMRRRMRTALGTRT
jgi:hypothetical protein